MRRTILGAILGAVIGAMLFFPPSIPLSFAITLRAVETTQHLSSQTLRTADVLFWVLPMVGAIVGGTTGFLLASSRVPLVHSRHRLASFLVWFV
jgi:hypothetical protein